jgi:hypothetical protein
VHDFVIAGLERAIPYRVYDIADNAGWVSVDVDLQKLADELGLSITVRTCVDRLAGHTIAEEMDEVAVKGLHRVEVRDSSGDPDEAVLEIRYRKIRSCRRLENRRDIPR